MSLNKHTTERELLNCHGHLPSVFQGFGFWLTFTSVTCCICKRNIQGYWWGIVVRRWNNGVTARDEEGE